MADYRRVYDSRHLQADCQELGISSGTLRSVIEYGLPLLFLPLDLLCALYSDDAAAGHDHVAKPAAQSGRSRRLTLHVVITGAAGVLSLWRPARTCRRSRDRRHARSLYVASHPACHRPQTPPPLLPPGKLLQAPEM